MPLGNMPFPVMRLELENMKMTLLTALHEFSLQMDENLQQAVNDYCTPENLRRVIADETNRVLDAVIREEVRAWYTKGDGREVIKQAVADRLAVGETWTPLDDESEDLHEH